ncbi:MAG: pseudouridine synthase [Bacteroidota bacterium]
MKSPAPIRLNKYLSHAGICARRTADVLIQQGQITVNNQQITELGYRVGGTDVVRYRGQVVQAEATVYILLNKPKDCITALHDPQSRRTVIDVVRHASPYRIYPVGRLDRHTTGLLLLTNDGELAHKLAHPASQIRKTYEVSLDKPLTSSDLAALSAGVMLSDGICQVDTVVPVGMTGDTIRIGIHMGRYRVIRRLFEQLGYQVVKLDRVGYARLTKKGLGRGEWRCLRPDEISQLRKLVLK